MGPARLLDLTRLVSRLGRGPMTGVDRVEHAYLTELLRRPDPLFGLVRTAAGYLLLDRAGAARVASLAAGAPLGASDFLSRLTNWRSPLRGRAEATVRRVAVARASHPGLRRLLVRLPSASIYLNVGHSDLSDATLRTLHARFRVLVLVHDTIPLDHPSFSRPDTATQFARKLAAVSAHADQVIHLTNDARQKTETHFRRMGRVPPAITAPLGVPVPVPVRGRMPDGIAPDGPYFVALGTIEPRKNHALLLQVWRDLPDPCPLFVVGARGWVDPQLFDQMTATPGVTILSGLPDGEVATLLQGATALLFPSLAEGFGLPPVEAAALGTPVIASDLPVIREVLGDYPTYLDATDSRSWVETIATLCTAQVTKPARNPRKPPSWEEHFNTVLNFV